MSSSQSVNFTLPYTAAHKNVTQESTQFTTSSNLHCLILLIKGKINSYVFHTFFSYKMKATYKKNIIIEASTRR